MSSLNFLVPSHISDCVLAKQATWKCQQIQTKKKAPMKSLLSLVKDKGRTHLQESKRLENNTWLQLKITKNTVTPAPPMTGKGQVEF